jgi:large subunit ribosomal protein L35
MPKLKTNSAAKKRFKLTAKGKIKYKKAGLRHLLHQESSNIKRPKRKKVLVSQANMFQIKKLFPYG